MREQQKRSKYGEGNGKRKRVGKVTQGIGGKGKSLQIEEKREVMKDCHRKGIKLEGEQMKSKTNTQNVGINEQVDLYSSFQKSFEGQNVSVDFGKRSIFYSPRFIS